MPTVDIVWPFEANWSSPVQVTLSFKTDIWASRAGREQRRAARNTPRKTIEFDALVVRDELRAFRALLASRQGDEMLLLDETRRQTLADVSNGGATIGLPSVPDWVASDGPVFLRSPGGRQRELAFVDSASGSTINLTAASSAQVGWTIHPALQGRVAGDLQSPLLTDSVGRVLVVYNVTPGSEPARDLGDPEMTFNGREVFTRTPNWAEAVDLRTAFATETVDYGRGLTEVFKPVRFGTQTFRAIYLNSDADEALALQQLFERAAGRQGEFYLPSGLPDLVIAAPAASGTTTFRVAGRTVFDAYADDTVHRAIEVLLVGGQRIYRSILSMTLVGGDTIIQMGGSWPLAVSPATVNRISWMPVCRFASDEVTFEYLTDSVSRVALAIQTLEDLSPE